MGTGLMICLYIYEARRGEASRLEFSLYYLHYYFYAIHRIHFVFAFLINVNDIATWPVVDRVPKIYHIRISYISVQLGYQI